MRPDALPWLLLGGGAVAAWSLWPRPVSAAPPAFDRERSAGGELAESAAVGWVWPVRPFRDYRPTISDGWGSPRDGGRRRHLGVDIMFRRRSERDHVAEFPPGSPHGSRLYFMPGGIPAIAVADGVVWSAGPTRTGQTVVLDHGRPFATVYRHLEALHVTPTERGRTRQRVERGQAIGIIGASPVDREGLKHLHFEVLRDGVHVDPAPLLARARVLGLEAAAPRNGSLVYRPVGERGEPYPDWLRAIKGESGVYVIRERQRDAEPVVVYVGESHSGRLYETLTRHFQEVRHEAQEVPMT